LVWTPTLAHNDVLPDCTVAALANSLRVWALLQGFDEAINDDALLAYYAARAGCKDTIAAMAATNGLVALDLLEHAAVNGFDVGQQVAPVPNFASVPANDLSAMRDAIDVRGSLYLGVNLYEDDMNLSKPWTGTPGNGLVGGHMVLVWAYTENQFRIATWGMHMTADRAWVMSRAAEAYSVGWSQ
jgi:hypothetical protein